MGGLKEKNKHLGLSTMATSRDGQSTDEVTNHISLATSRDGQSTDEVTNHISLATSRDGQSTDEVTNHISLNLNTNYNEADAKSDPDMNAIPPGETDLSQTTQADVGLALGPENVRRASSEYITENVRRASREHITENVRHASREHITENVRRASSEYKIAHRDSLSGVFIVSDIVEDQDSLNELVEPNIDAHRHSFSDGLVAPDITVTAATPAVIELPENHDHDRESSRSGSHVEALYSEKVPVHKILSFDDSLTQTIFIFKEESSNKIPLDDVTYDFMDLPVASDSVENQGMPEQREDLSGESNDIGITAIEPKSANIESPMLSMTAVHIKTDEEVAEQANNDGFPVIKDIDFERPLRSDFSDYTLKSHVPDSRSSLESSPQTQCMTRVLKSIDKVVYKDGVAMMWKKIDYCDREFLVPVPPNSIASDHSNFDRKPAKDKCTSELLTYEAIDATVKRMLGLTSYRIIMGQPTDKGPKVKIPGADWTRQLKTERLSSQPHYLYSNQWKHNNLLKRCLGPGSYNIKDFIQLANEKPRSGRGTCDNLGPRYDKNMQSSTPGPGTYGIGGVPQRALEDNASRAFSTKGMLDTGDRKRDLPFIGADLAPCTYNFKSFTEELLNKNAKTKNSLNDYPGESNREISTGYFSTPKQFPMGPGHYQFKTFVEEICSPKYHFRGRFSKSSQHPDVPTERMLVSSGQYHSQAKDTPSPSTYTVKEFPKFKTVNTPGFLSSAPRDDKMAQRFFTGSSIPVGPGRYNVEKYVKAQFVSGHSNVFKSKTGKPSLQMSQILQSRLQPTQKINQVCQCQKENINRSITGM